MRRWLWWMGCLCVWMCLPLVATAFSADREITILSREEGSGTRGAFVDLLGIYTTDAQGEKWDLTDEEAVITNATSVVLMGVAQDPAAIGYVSMGSLGEGVRALGVDGVPATPGAVKTGEYRLARPFLLATGPDPSEETLDFLDFILSREGQAVVEAHGYIATDDAAPAYVGSGRGKVVVAGSSSVTPVMEKLKEAYLALNPEASVEIQQSDSTTGIQSVAQGIADIGMASRELKPSEESRDIHALTFAMDGIAVIVHPLNPHTGLTTEQLRAVFTGAVTTWSEVTP